VTEIQKITKYSLLLYAIGGFIFAFLYLAITDIFLYDLTDWPFNDPFYPRAFGGTLLVLGIVALLGYFKKEWEHLKLTYELSLMWLAIILILNILELAIPNPAYSAIAMGNTVFNTVILAVFLAIGIYCYIKQRG